MDENDLRQPFERLWTPWRMAYIGGAGPRPECVFCDLAAASDDAAALVLARTERAFLAMNLYPYNTGHVLIIPYAHTPSPIEADPENLATLGELLQPTLRAIKRALRPDGFNCGINSGAAGGAGVPGHLHMHVVPRWVGDASFLPVLGWTKPLPELLPTTYAKLRIELARDLYATSSVSLCILDSATSTVLVDTSGRFPTCPLVDEEAAWATAVGLAREHGLDTAVAGWAGSDPADAKATGALALTRTGGELASTSRWHWANPDNLPDPDRTAAMIALSRLADSSPLSQSWERGRG